MCDRLCCKDAVSPLLDTFARSLCHSFLVPPASPASPYLILPCLSTLQAFSPPLPLFICCLSTFLACQLGRREVFSWFGFITWWGAAAAGTPKACAAVPGWWRGCKSKGLCCALASYFHSVGTLYSWCLSLTGWNKLVCSRVAGREDEGQLDGMAM